MPCCTLHPRTYLFYNWKLYLLIPFTHFIPPTPRRGLVNSVAGGWGECSQSRKEAGDDQKCGCFLSVCVLNVSVVLVNSINVIFLAPLFMILAERIRQIM